MSFGSPKRNAKWIENQSYDFEVWTDDDKTLALHYGAVGSSMALVPSRVTKVLDAEGQLVLEYVDGVSVGTHPQDVLEDCAALFGDGTVPPWEDPADPP